MSLFPFSMKIKVLVNDFVVEELYDLHYFKQKEGEGGYNYFLLTKTNYAQIRALGQVARVFNTSPKLINFAGTKDKVGITTQLISVKGVKKENLEKNVEFCNENVKDISLEYIGEFNARVNLGENLGNKFSIIVRDLELEDVERMRKNLLEIEKRGVLNFVDDQRFGYANNSHIVGKYILQNEIELAVKEVLTSLPQNQYEEHGQFVQEIKDNWENIKEKDVEVISSIQKLAPRFLDSEVKVLEHLKKFKNDFPGALRKIHKKIRTLYISAYQSYIFNEEIKELWKKNELTKDTCLDLIHSKSVFEGSRKELIESLLEKDSLSLESFNLPSMPELKGREATRDALIFPQEVSISKEEDDEEFEGKKKVVVSFSLGSGEYATNVIKQLYNSELSN